MKINSGLKLFLISLAGLILPRIIIAQEIKDPRPNIIFILSDDAGYGDFGKYGQKDIHTPNIDRMADEGIMFTDHYAGAPVCAPSRSSLLTGLHTGHTPVRGNKEVQPEGQFPLPEDTFTVAGMLRNADVDTAVIGKWGLGYPGSTGTPEKQGFDYFYGYNCQRQAHNYYPGYIRENEQKIYLEGDTYTHDLFTERALEYVEDHQSDPFFLYLAYAIPHAALQVPDLEPYKDKPWPENKKKFAAMMTRMDSDIGRLLTRLEELGMEKNTLVIFSSDNGPHNEGGADPGYFNSAGSFRGIKRDLYEGGIRIPLIARWPGTIPEGQISDHPSAFWDFLPTAAEIYNIQVPSGIDGISYLPELTGYREGQQKHENLYWEFHENGGIQAVRMGDWKGVRKFVRLFPNGPIELYNLKTDPGETRDIAKREKEIAENIKRIMDSSRTASEDFPLLGKTPFRTGLENGWLFLIPLIISGTVLYSIQWKKGLIKVRDLKGHKQLIRFGTSVLMASISTFSPLMVMSRWFTASAITALIFTALYITEKSLNLKKSRQRYFSDLFLLLFWISLGSSAPSWPYLFSLILWSAARLIPEKMKEKHVGLKRKNSGAEIPQ